MSNSDPETEQFLLELTELTRKHKVRIGACGCCNSPWVTKVEKNDNSRYWLSGEKDGLAWSEINPYRLVPPNPAEEEKKQQKKQQEQDDVVMYAKWKIRQLEAKDAIRGDGI